MHFELFIEAHTPRGVFSGRPHKDPVEDTAALERLRDELQRNHLSSIVLHDQQASGVLREIALKGDMLAQSVLVYAIRLVAEPAIHP